MFVDKRLLIHSVRVAKQPTETNDYGEAAVTEWIDMANVRIDVSNTTTGSDNNKDKQANGTLFVYPKYSKPAETFDKTWGNGFVEYDGVQYRITSVQKFTYPYSDRVFSYEIGVV